MKIRTENCTHNQITFNISKIDPSTRCSQHFVTLRCVQKVFKFDCSRSRFFRPLWVRIVRDGIYTSIWRDFFRDFFSSLQQGGPIKAPPFNPPRIEYSTEGFKGGTPIIPRGVYPMKNIPVLVAEVFVGSGGFF